MVYLKSILTISKKNLLKNLNLKKIFWMVIKNNLPKKSIFDKFIRKKTDGFLEKQIELKFQDFCNFQLFDIFWDQGLEPRLIVKKFPVQNTTDPVKRLAGLEKWL